MTAAVAAENDFSRTVPREAFVAAGLEKLTPAELARLDALVREYKVGPDSAGTATTTRATQPNPKAQPERGGAGAPAATLEQLEDRLRPSLAIETRIVGRFTGWNGRTVFALENGERWRVSHADSTYYTRPIENPKVKIEPASLGGFWMTILDVNQRVRVTPLGRR